MTGAGAAPLPGRILVVGLGNVLMGDDGLGPYVVACLEAHYRFPPSVELLDAGTPGHELAVLLEGRESVVVVDAVSAKGEPGTLVRLEGDEILSRPLLPLLNAHEPGLREALTKLAFCGRAPGRILLVGVIPGQVSPGGRLSDAVRRAVPAAEAAVADALSLLGSSPEPRGEGGEPRIWWEAGLPAGGAPDGSDSA